MELRRLVRLCLVLVMMPCSVITQSCVSPTDKCTCFVQESKKIINCRYQGLTEIPTFNPSDEVYDEIDFSSTDLSGPCTNYPGCNNITMLNQDAFANLSVKSIDLRNNLITNISDFAFTNLRNILEGLLIEGDTNNNPPYNAIAVLENLKLLQLYSYGSTQITTSTGAVLPLPHLQSLTIRNWPNLQDLEQNVFSIMVDLNEFELFKLPSLTDLPVPTIHMFSKLTKIVIEETKIASILGEVFSTLSLLSEVSIRHNGKLNNIDNRAFHEVTDTIEILDLDANDLSSVSFLLESNWTKITHLNIGYNYRILSLPNGIFSSMPTLTYLQCQEIRLTSINEGIFRNLPNLHTLDLSHNKIQNIAPATFQNSPNMVELRLNSQTNGLITFQDNVFTGIENSLEMLELSENDMNLSQMWTDISILAKLKILELKNVGIATIPNKTFADLQNLVSIYLPLNNISEINQETFFGPKDTLTLIDLSDNNIETIDRCVLSDFPSKPSLHLLGNRLHCDCELVWLFDLVSSNQASDTVELIGPCSSPDSLANKLFNQFTRNDMCPGGTPIPNCPDLYATTTTSTTTTTTTTTTPTTTTEAPLPSFELRVNDQGSEYIELTWIITDKTHVTGVKLEMNSNYAPTQVKHFGAEETSFTFYKLRPENYYTFCLILEINGAYREGDPDCEQGRTLAEYTQPPVSTTTAPPESDSQIGLIAGGAAGGVVLLALIIAIVVILLKKNKPKKQKQLSGPVSFTLRADIPHEGGTAKRFAKKVEKEGVEPDDINVTVISNGDMSNHDRLSAGSYQTLNEKGIDRRPMPGTSNGHYTNSVEDRPLPCAPHGASNWSGGATGHGYVNAAMDKNKNQHLPETSTNTYNEVRY